MSDLPGMLLQGAMIGALYALFAAGMSVSLGVIRLVNLAHGDLIVAFAYAAWLLAELLRAPPAIVFVVVPCAGAVIGYALQRTLLNRTLGGSIVRPMLVTFGLSVVLQNLLLVVFTADSRKMSLGPIETASLALSTHISIGWLAILVFAASVAIILGLDALIGRSRMGREFRAVADDPETAELMSLDPRHTFALAMGVSCAVSAVAGVLLAAWTSFTPLTGPVRLLTAFEVVVIGGLGSVRGTLAGGLLLGIAQSAGGYVDPAWQVLAGHLMFVALIIVRPRGLFPGHGA